MATTIIQRTDFPSKERSLLLKILTVTGVFASVLFLSVLLLKCITSLSLLAPLQGFPQSSNDKKAMCRVSEHQHSPVPPLNTNGITPVYSAPLALHRRHQRDSPRYFKRPIRVAVSCGGGQKDMRRGMMHACPVWKRAVRKKFANQTEEKSGHAHWQ